VDVFVYDTSKDSDGGAWRTGALAQASSWYNETLNTATRGSRREFPAVAVIAAESTKVTIYDGDDPSLPMWMVITGFSTGFVGDGFPCPASSCSAVNGEIVVGIFTSSSTGFGGTISFRFAADETVKSRGGVNSNYGRKDGIVAGNWGGLAEYQVPPLYYLVNGRTNDVAMTVLPDAPIDPATGLPVPTIAVATDGGVSVIKDDGTVVDSGLASPAREVLLTDQGVWWNPEGRTTLYFAAWSDVEVGDGFGDVTASVSVGLRSFDLLTYSYELANTKDGFAVGGIVAALGAVPGLMLHQPNYTDQTKGMSALTTSTYNTGWMPGDTKLAALSDTDDTDLVGSTPLDDDFTSYADQAAAEAAGWTADTGWTFDAANDRWDFDASIAGAGVVAGLTQTCTTVVGQTYHATFVVSNFTNLDPNEAFIKIDGIDPVDSSGSRVGTSGDGTYTLTFVATSTTTYFFMRSGGVTEGDETWSLDSVAIKLADADRSVNG
jgi:hypothetical protein